MEYLPQDLIYEIVLRLPVKGLIRFSFVSKLWKAVIYSKDFIKEHQQRRSINNSKKDFTLIRHGVQSGDFHHFYAASFSADTLEEEQQIEHPIYSLEEEYGLGLHTRIITVCHGLVLLGVLCRKATSNYVHLYVWNPVIAKHRYISQPIWPEGEDSHFTYGIGYHCDEDDLKVLVLRQTGRRPIWKIQFIVCSVATGQWKRITKLPPSNLQVNIFCYYNMVSLSDSRVAWLMADVDYMDLYHVVTFDLVKEEYNTYRVPISIRGPGAITLMELGGFLCFRHGQNIWFMKDSSWSTEPIPLNNSRPLFFDGERFLLSRFSGDHKELFWYNIKTQDHQHVTRTGDYAGSFDGATTQTAFICGGNLRFLLDGQPDLYAYFCRP
ncbi:putative F-box domain-containing protein [Rosa chinensis]|uniref:Putative F-box domain-containing protein n=1 Tax=Rosa chinensis TaxID=74649 RepID=A0A2P6P4F2_ROSCH|nr:F-box/kelch-repeat protein At3g23880 [Rosa chinensis]PRQ16793.1 putative F-box domain-containing protein [Rosa chinensis]